MGNMWKKKEWDTPLLDWSEFAATFARTGHATRRLHLPSGPAVVTLKRQIAMPDGYTGAVTLVAVGEARSITAAWLVRLAEETLGLIVTGHPRQDAESGGWQLTARVPVIEEVA
ncbi:MAG: hypothetical protein IVW57_15840 [Ktedonobacterales bacterium]|nr:hypothetical protein [Ktedonobacterales bacterium]